VPLNLLDAEVRTLLLDVLNGLLKIELSHIRPDKLALLGVNLNILHQIQQGVQYLLGSPALGRIHPLEKSIEEAIIVEDGRFRRLLALLAHDADPLMSLNRLAAQPSRNCACLPQARHGSLRSL
jgi:hypothetical protein